MAGKRQMAGAEHWGRRACSRCSRALGRVRLGMGQRLHLRSRCLRAVAAVDALDGRDDDLHGHGNSHGLRFAALGITIMSVLLQFIVGLIFGFGLIVSGMSNPAKVLNFLDFVAIRTGTWDASLAFVMAGAIAVTFTGFKLVLERSQPVFGERFHLPAKGDIDARVVAGPALFGIGWGLAGFCPGPAITALGLGTKTAAIFVVAMLAGMWLARFIASRPSMSRMVTPADRLGA